MMFSLFVVMHLVRPSHSNVNTRAPVAAGNDLLAARELELGAAESLARLQNEWMNIRQ